MNCPNCNAPVDQETIFCGNCGYKIAPQIAPGVTVAEATQQVSGVDERQSYPPRDNSYSPTLQVSNPANNEQRYSPYIKSPAQAGLPPVQTPPPQIMPPAEGRTSRRTVFLIGALIVLVIVASGALVTILQNLGKPSTSTASATKVVSSAPTSQVAASGAFATAFFSDSIQAPGSTDTVKITASNLSAPASGYQYSVWIVDDASERLTALGALQPQTGSLSLAYTNPQHVNLLSLGTEFRVTLEKQGSTTITGKTVLTASMPTGAFTHVRHLLFHFDTTPKNVGLLVGLHQEASLLFAQANLLQTAQNQHNTAATQCYAQSILDIIGGTHGQLYMPLAPACASANLVDPGDGFGLLDLSGNGNGYVALAKAHAGFAAQAPDTTETVKIHSQHVQICMDNIAGWLKDIQSDAQNILQNKGTDTQVKEIGQRANLVLNGTDLNNDESVDPVPGEGGATTGYIHGQLMAQLRLDPPK
jgi:hypothetical protein